MTGLFAALAFTAVAQSNEWRNPEVNAVNRAPMHANFFAYETAEVAAKETVLVHFQYTSDFPVASDRSVMGNEPKPPNRPMSMSNVSVTVTSSLS